MLGGEWKIHKGVLHWDETDSRWEYSTDSTSTRLPKATAAPECNNKEKEARSSVVCMQM